MKWKKGRQEETEYWKLTLWFFRLGKFGFDAYILKYAPNTVLQPHRDPVKDAKHWRLNIKLKGSSTFWLENLKKTHYTYSKRWINFFRPDIQEHALSVHKQGCVKLSLGFAKFQ